MLALFVCFAGLMTFLFLAAITDLRERRIPNWLSGGVAALYPVYLLLSPVPVAWPGALALGLLVGLVGVGAVRPRADRRRRRQADHRDEPLGRASTISRCSRS